MNSDCLRSYGKSTKTVGTGKNCSKQKSKYHENFTILTIYVKVLFEVST